MVLTNKQPREKLETKQYCETVRPMFIHDQRCVGNLLRGEYIFMIGIAR